MLNGRLLLVGDETSGDGTSGDGTSRDGTGKVEGKIGEEAADATAFEFTRDLPGRAC